MWAIAAQQAGVSQGKEIVDKSFTFYYKEKVIVLFGISEMIQKHR